MAKVEEVKIKKTVFIAYCITFVILVALLAFSFFSKPKIRTITTEKTIYVKSDAVITGGTSASIAPDGAVSVTGENLSVVARTESRTIEKEVTKYAQADWFVAVSYAPTSNVEVLVCRRIIGPVWAGGGVSADLPMFADIKYRVYLGVTF